MLDSLKFCNVHSKKTYGRLRILDETESRDFVKQSENETFDSLHASISSTLNSTVYSNLELTPRSKVKAVLERFDMDEFELSKRCFHSVKNYNTYSNGNLSSEIISDDNAYERVKKMLINQGMNKGGQVNKGLFNVFDTSLFSDSSEKLIFGSDKYFLSSVTEFDENFGLKDKLGLMQSSQKKNAHLKIQKVETSFDNILEHNSSIEKDFSLIKKEKIKRTITKKAMEEMLKETERIDRGMALVPERKLDKKTSILNFLKKVGYKTDFLLESSLDHQGLKEESGATRSVSKLDISFMDNYFFQNSDNLNMSSKNQKPFSLDFGIMNITSKFPKATKDCSTPRKIRHVDTQIHKKMSFKTLVSENSSDSELEIDSSFCNSKILGKESKSFIRYKKTDVSYFDLARLGSPSQKSRIKNKLFDHELLVKAAEQVKFERFEREDEFKQKGIILTFFEELKVEDIKKNENRSCKDSDNNEDIWSDVYFTQSVEKSNHENFYSVDSYNGYIVHGNDNMNTNANFDFSDHLDLEDIQSTKIYDVHQISQSDGINDTVVRKKTYRNNSRRIIMDDENEHTGFCNFGLLQDSVDNTLNLSQFFSSTLPNKHVTNNFLQNNIVNGDIVNNSLDVNDLSKETSLKLSQSDVDVNLEVLDNMNNSDCKSMYCSDNGNSEKIEKEFENTQLSMFDPPSSDIVFNSSPISYKYLHSNTAEDGLNASVDSLSNILIHGNSKGKKRLIQRVSNDSNDGDITNNNKNMFYLTSNSKYNSDTDDDKYIASKPEEFIEDQAQESDDEYAGLGGASDDDDDDDLNNAEELEDIIDNTVSSQDIDASDIAAYYMYFSYNDMKIINSLYNDITTGNLKKRRNTMLFDLDDSEDEESLQRRNKRAQIIRQKLLDDQINNPKMKAFLNTIEDNQENLQTFVDIDNENSKLQKSSDIKSLFFSDAVSNVDSIAEDISPKSGILYSRKHVDIKKERSFFVDQQDTEILADMLIDNDDIEKKTNNLIGVIDRVTDECLSKEFPCFSPLVFNKGKSLNLFSKRSLFGKDHLFNNDDYQVEKKKTVLGEVFKINSINFASKLASRAVNYNRPAITKNLKVVNSKILNKKTVNEKRKNNVLKLFQTSTITV
ncbi:hypothetical protein PMAC_002185 [Pneumocystis sp. 'macacae']|nr:hypothetical protein PMAC_002185 [Pneumocystis sp. 'macacae']